MKAIIFKIVIILLIVSGIFMYATKGKYFEGFKNKISSNEILPKEKWESTLIGHWEIESITNSTNSILRFKGDVEYKSDKSFIRYVNMKYYENTRYEVKETKSNLEVESGGRIEGTWSILEEGNYWKEEIINCEGAPSYSENNEANIKSHCSFFEKNKPYYYGTWGSSKSKDKMIIFSPNKIVIEGQNFGTDGKKVYTLTRKK